MMPMPSRRAVFALLGSLALAACSNRLFTRSTTAPPHASTATTTHSAGRQRPQVASASSAKTSKAPLPDRTGIAACDDYLSSYLACHRAAAIFPPSQLQARYEAMRINLLRDSMNPKIRPQLAARCNSLATQLRQALHGKSCDVNPAPTASSP